MLQLPVPWGNHESDTHIPQIALKDLVPDCKHFENELQLVPLKAETLSGLTWQNLLPLSIFSSYAMGNAMTYSSNSSTLNNLRQLLASWPRTWHMTQEKVMNLGGFSR